MRLLLPSWLLFLLRWIVVCRVPSVNYGLRPVLTGGLVLKWLPRTTVGARARTPHLHGAGRPSLRAAVGEGCGGTAGRLRRGGLERRQLPRLRPRALRRPRPACRLPARHPAGDGRGAGAGARTPRPGASSWRGCKARSPSVARSRCCATASGTARTTSTSSTAPLRPATSRLGTASSGTGSPSLGSFATAGTRRSGRSTSRSSSTACRSSPSSSRTTSPSRRWTTRSSSTGRTATRARSCSSLAVASPTSPSTRPRCVSAPTSGARRRGSCPSTAAGTTARATRPTRAASRPTTCGARC